jgi:hypothetical protein
VQDRWGANISSDRNHTHLRHRVELRHDLEKMSIMRKTRY